MNIKIPVCQIIGPVAAGSARPVPAPVGRPSDISGTDEAMNISNLVCRPTQIDRMSSSICMLKFRSIGVYSCRSR